MLTGRIIPDDAWGILCIKAEAGFEPYEGKVAVGITIRNRTKARWFSLGTVASTVCWPSQYSWMNTSYRHRGSVLSAKWEECVDEIRAWQESETSKMIPGAVSYYNPDLVKKPMWADSDEFELIKKIAHHVFYRRSRE